MSTTEQPTQKVDQPPLTVAADVEGSGMCYVPDVFASDLQHMCASLDWARVFNGTGQFALAGTELDAAAEAARMIAERCERLSAMADQRVD